MERVAPSQVNYDDQLPIAISSKSQRREFFPEGGSTYGPNGGSNPNILRIPVNADSMLDVQNSYLKFDFNNGSNKKIAFDSPQSFIKRLRILSGGVVLEDIDQYGRLYAGILYPAQANYSMVNASSVASGQPLLLESGKLCLTHEAIASGLASGSSQTFCIHLASGLLNMDKYVPLVMMNAGFTIELEFDVSGSVGITETDGTYAWTLSNFRYVAHLIDLERDFYDRLRMVMEGSGGVLQLAGQTYRHYSGTWDSNSTNTTINVPARVKSIKSILFKGTKEADIADVARYAISSGPNHDLSEYQFRIGAVVYPPNSVKVSATNKGEALFELEKAFGHLSGYNISSDIINSITYLGDTSSSSATSGVYNVGAFGLDFESFNRSAIENGVNTADRSLPITLEVKAGSQVAQTTTIDAYVLCDAIFYVNMDGTCSVSV